MSRSTSKKITKNKYCIFSKYSFVIILSGFLTYNRNFFYSSSIVYRFESPSMKIWEESYSYFNITEIKNKKIRQLFLKNKTEYYRRTRTKFLLLKHNVIYNESKLETFKDKLNWLIIHESPQYKSFLADKIRLHEYSKKVLGKDICVPILKIYDNFDEINFNELPNKFVLKYNHGSGFNIICKDKSKLNLENVRENLNIRDPNYKIDKPKNLKLMLEYAKLLSQEFVFVRVDFYEVKNKIYLGELTFSPANAVKKWKNKTDDLTLGNLLNLNKIKIYLYNK